MTHSPSLRRLLLRSAQVALALGMAWVLASCKPVPGCDSEGGGPQYLSVPAQTTAPSCGPPPPCEGCGGVSGDPHMTTYDQFRYSLQTAAEVVGTRTYDGTFEVQWRQEPLGSTSTSGVTAVAMRVGGNRITVVGDGPVLRIDGDQVDAGVDETILLPTGTRVHRLERQIIVVAPDDEASVHLQLSSSAMGVLIDPPGDQQGSLQGLLGDDDGDPDGDLVFADGEVIESPTWDDLHPGLAEAWRVTDADTLFDYEDGAGPDTYWDPTFPERRVTIDDFSEDEQAEAESICRAAGVSDPGILRDCIFDVLVTGDPSMAELHAAQQAAAGQALDPRESGGSDDVEDGRGELVEGAVTWSAVLDGVNHPEDVVSVGEHLVVHARDAEDGVGVLMGIDAGDGSQVWRVDGINVNGDVVVVGDRVVALSMEEGPLAARDRGAAIVAIDAATGEVLDDVRHDPDRDADEPFLQSSSALTAIGDVVIYELHGVINAYDAAELSFLWQVRPSHGVGFGPHPVGERSDATLAWIGGHSDEGDEISALDLDTGEILATATVPGRVRDAAASVALPGGDLLVGVAGEDENVIVRLQAGTAGGEVSIEEVWSATLDEDERLPRWFGLAGDTVVGYTAGSEVTAFDLGDGDRSWNAALTSFNNNGGQVIGDSDGNAYLASFGGAYLESYDEDGRRRWALDSEQIMSDGQPGAVSVVGPVVGDVVMAASSIRDGLVLVAVPTTG